VARREDDDDMNWLVIPTLALAFALCGVGGWLSRQTHGKVAQALVFVLALLLAMPGVLFVTDYLHLFDNAAWFYHRGNRHGVCDRRSAGGPAGVAEGQSPAALGLHRVLHGGSEGTATLKFNSQRAIIWNSGNQERTSDARVPDRRFGCPTNADRVHFALSDGAACTQHK